MSGGDVVSVGLGDGGDERAGVFVELARASARALVSCMVLSSTSGLEPMKTS